MADTTNRIAGEATLTVDGQAYLVSGDFEYNPSLVKRETLVGLDKVHGYKESPTVPFIKATLRDAGGLSVADLNAMTNVTLVSELANGKTIVGRNMWTVNEQTAKAEDGSIDTEWQGPTGSVTEN
jgi:hypothetical protein